MEIIVKVNSLYRVFVENTGIYYTFLEDIVTRIHEDQRLK